MYHDVFSEFLADLCWQNRISYQKPSWTPIDWVIEWAFCTEYNQSKWNYKIHVNFMFYCTLYLIIGSNKNKKKKTMIWLRPLYSFSRVVLCIPSHLLMSSMKIFINLRNAVWDFDIEFYYWFDRSSEEWFYWSFSKKFCAQGKRKFTNLTHGKYKNSTFIFRCKIQ